MTHWQKEFHITSLEQWRALSKRAEGYLMEGGKPFYICLREGSPKRSIKQNKYQWGVVYEYAVAYYKEHVGNMIRDILEAVEFKITKEFVHELFKVLFNYKESTAENSTVKEMKYLDKIRHHFWHKYQYDIPPPNTPPMPNESLPTIAAG